MGNKFERNDGGGDGSGSITKAHWYEEWCTIQQHAVQLVYIYYAKVILIERNNSNTFHSHEYKRGNALRMGRVKHALYDCKHWKESICFSHKLALHTRLFYGSREIFFLYFPTVVALVVTLSLCSYWQLILTSVLVYLLSFVPVCLSKHG